MRTCSRCNEEKDESAFGAHAWCKLCFADYSRARRANESEKERRARLDKRNAWVKANSVRVREQERNAQRKRYQSNPNKFWIKHLKNDYHITPEQWFDMFERQGGVCGICKQPPKEGQRRFAVDHDHNCCSGFGSCGKCIRGLLCSYCNTKIEFAVNNIDAIHEWINK